MLVRATPKYLAGTRGNSFGHSAGQNAQLGSEDGTLCAFEWDLFGPSGPPQRCSRMARASEPEPASSRALPRK